MTTEADLLFSLSAATTGDLIFGDTGAPPEASASITGSFQPLTCAIFAVRGETATISGAFEPLTVSVVTDDLANARVTASFAPLTVSVAGTYMSNTERPLVNHTDSNWQVADSPSTAGVTAEQQSARSGPAGWQTFWQRATGLQPGIEHRLPDVLRAAPMSRETAYQEAKQVTSGGAFTSQEADRSLRVLLANAFENAAAVRQSTLFRHQDGDRTKRASRTANWQLARQVSRSIGTTFQPAAPYLKGLATRYQEAVPPPAGISLPPLPPGPNQPCYTPNPHLLFSFPSVLTGDLLFQCGDYSPGQTIVVPIKKVYIVINATSLCRVSDNAPIPTFSLSLSLDAASWTWGFDATMPLESQALVEPTGGPVELRAVVNGTEFRLIAESMSRERTFGRASLRVAGRGRNAILDAPYAPITNFANAEARTAQQIAGDVLTVNGVSIGWSVDWGLTDWLVPAGVFSHQGTHISALDAIAKAAGGYLQPHRTGMALRVLPRYPSAPWEWSSVAPDFELPADVTTRESVQWVDKPEYNRVYVSGQQAGVLGRVTRAGTAGDLLAQMVVDPLITHADAARQRGISILSDTGRIATIGLSLPVLEQTGVIEPGKFVRYVDGATQRLGIVRSTSVTVGASAVDTRQQLVLETHP